MVSSTCDALMPPCASPPGHAWSDATALMTSEASSRIADSGTTSPVDSSCAQQIREADARGDLADDVHRGAGTFDAADRRERADVEVGVPRRAGANRLFEDRL